MRRHHLLAPLLAASLALSPACAHHRPTNRQLGYAAIITGFIALALIAASASHCEDNACLDGLSLSP